MSDIPKGAKVPQDHKPAVQIEAEGVETVEVAWRDHTFTLPTDMDTMSVKTMLAFENGLVASAIRGVLGDKQWAEFMKTQPLALDLRSLFEAIGPAIGLSSTGE